MRSADAPLLIPLLLLLAAGPSEGQSHTALTRDSPGASAEPVRIFFFADAHSRHQMVERFIVEANRERPDIVLEGGDIVHDATEAEFRAAFTARDRFEPPWYAVPGNHDLEERGPFTVRPPTFPNVAAFTHSGIRFILLDNHQAILTEEQFQQLEAELHAHAGERIIVVMHFPALLTREPFIVRLRHLLPYRLASPTMRDPEQVERFTGLMERYGVLAVLSGHAHFPDRLERGGVDYITTGTLGGLRPGLGLAHQYSDITIDGRDLRVRRVPLNHPRADPISFVAHAFRFYADLNSFNHAEQGWNYVPSASVQLRGSIRRTEAGDRDDAALWGAASFERQLGARGRQAFFADVGLSAGRGELATHLGAGYKLRPVGDFNRNLFLAGGVTGNAGLLVDRLSAGVGTDLGIGFEWETLTLELSRNWSTNLRATGVTLGRRF